MEREMQKTPKNSCQDERQEDVPVSLNADSKVSGAMYSDVGLQEIKQVYSQNLDYIEQNHVVTYCRPIENKGIKKLVKKVILRLYRFVLEPTCHEQNTFNTRVVSCQKAQQDWMKILESSMVEMDRKIQELTEINSRQNTQIRNFEELINRYQEQQLEFSRLLGLGNVEESAYDHEFWNYHAFQNEFRGSVELIKERLSMYLPYFKNSSAPVLDIGFGRGEFLQIMKEHNIPSLGIDMCREYVEAATNEGLDVRYGDGIKFLAETDMVFGGIISCHVIEHIGFQNLLELCRCAYDKLVPGSYLILETPNPLCLSVFSNAFYMDPSHNKPVHPALLKYILEQVGFKKVDIIFTECSSLEGLPLIKSEGIYNLEEVNGAIQRVSNLLYGSQDYAVVAIK